MRKTRWLSLQIRSPRKLSCLWEDSGKYLALAQPQLVQLACWPLHHQRHRGLGQPLQGGHEGGLWSLHPSTEKWAGAWRVGATKGPLLCPRGPLPNVGFGRSP